VDDAEPDITASPGLMSELSALDRAIYSAVAQSSTPTLDEFFRKLSRISDKSVLWFGTAAVLAAVGGPPGGGPR
jgi:hypothetical protein